MSRRFSALAVEFAHHLPYTIISSLIALAAVWFFGVSQMQGRGVGAWAGELDWSFHVLHPLHVCLSAITTTAALWRAQRQLARAVGIGIVGSVIPCGLSDYFVPFVGGRLLGQTMRLHVCLIEHPMLILPFLAVGVCGGLLFQGRVSEHSVFSHGAHVFVSSLAALLYMASFGFTGWMSDVHLVFPVFLVVVIAVWVPCCISDIVIPISAIQEPADAGHRPLSRASV